MIFSYKVKDAWSNLTRGYHAYQLTRKIQLKDHNPRQN